MKLYGTVWAPFPRRVLLYLAVKGMDQIEFETVVTIRGETRTEQFLKKNPSGKVPVLEIEDGKFLYESHAIMQYLEERFPEPPMCGVTEAERRRVDVQAGLVNEFFYHCFLSVSHLSPYVSRALTQAHDVDIVTRPLWWMRCEQIVEVMGADRYLAGNTPTIPDCMLFGMLEYIAPLYGVHIPPHLKKLADWYARFQAIPGLPLLQFPQWYHDEYRARYGTRI